MTGGMDEDRARAALELAEASASALRGVDGNQWLLRLERAFPTLESAFNWFLDQGLADEATDLAASLAGFWMASRRLEVGRDWLARSLSNASGSSERMVATALFEAGLLAFWQGDDDAARHLHQESLERARRLKDPTLTAMALSGLARIALRNDPATAQQLGEEALAAVRGTDDHKGLSHALHVLGVAAQMAGDLETAIHYMAQRLQGARESDDLVTINSEAANLSVVERQLGNLDRAQELAREALQIAHARGDEWAIPYDLNGFAAIALERGELERAAKLLSAAEALLQAQGASWPPDEAHHFEATRRRLAEAMTDGAFAHAWAAGHAMSSETAVSYALAPPL